MNANIGGAPRQLNKWLEQEKSYRYGKFPRSTSIDGILSRGQFEPGHILHRVLHMYADRADITVEATKGTSPTSRQLLAKHISAVSFFLLDARYAAMEEGMSDEERATRKSGHDTLTESFDEKKRINLNLRRGIAHAQGLPKAPTYTDLGEDIKTLQGPEFAASFDLQDDTTWRPYIHHLGIAAHILCAEVAEGNPLPVGGVANGLGLDHFIQ